MDDGPRPITDADERAAVRAQARGVLLRSLGATLLVLATCALLVFAR